MAQQRQHAAARAFAGRGVQRTQRHLPRQAPAILAPAASPLLAAIADERVSQPIGLGRLSVATWDEKAWLCLQCGPPFRPMQGYACDGELGRQHITLPAVGVIGRRVVDGADGTVRKVRCVELRSIKGAAFVPKTFNAGLTRSKRPAVLDPLPEATPPA